MAYAIITVIMVKQKINGKVKGKKGLDCLEGVEVGHLGNSGKLSREVSLISPNLRYWLSFHFLEHLLLDV